MTAPVQSVSRTRAVLLVVDIQEKLIPAMPAGVAEQVIKNSAILIQAAATLGLPIVVSQQYPKGLGSTVAAIETALAAATAAGASVHRFDKIEFSAAAAPAFSSFSALPAPERTKARGFVGVSSEATRDQWIVCGMETHVCVYQTVRDLVAGGPEVYVVSDAVCSRTKANWRIGMNLATRVGGVPTSTEVVVFDLLGKAGSDEFKTLSKAIK